MISKKLKLKASTKPRYILLLTVPFIICISFLLMSFETNQLEKTQQNASCCQGITPYAYILKYSNNSDSLKAVCVIRHRIRGLGAAIDTEHAIKCEVVSYKLTRISEDMGVISQFNQGALVQGRTRTLLRMAKSGDKYIFEDIKVKCSFSKRQIKVKSLHFKIK